MARKQWLVALTAAALVTVAGCGGSHSKAGAQHRVEHPAVLRLDNGGGAHDPVGMWAQEVETLSHGKLKVYPGQDIEPTPDVERRIVAQVRSGHIAFALVGARVFDRVGDRDFQALAGPMLIDSYGLEAKVFASRIPQQMLESTRRLGVVGVALLPGPLRRMLGVTRSFMHPADFRGAVVGEGESALTETALRALGATPRPIAPGGPLTGLDGLESNLTVIFANGYIADSRSVTVTPVLWPRPYALIMSPRAFARLSPNQQAILRDAAARVSSRYVDQLAADEKSATRQLCRASANLIAANTAEFRNAFAPVYAQLEQDPRTASYIAQIEALKRGMTPDPAPSCGAQEASAPRGPTPLDGVWRTTRTPAQGGPQPENHGTFIHVFDRGRYAFQQWSRRACTWAFGTYTLHGREIRLVAIKAGGIAPTNANAKPGETIPLLWNVYRGRLSLPNAPEIHDSPIEATPYTLVDKAPSSKYFIKRCPPPANWDR
jgi:TRAP-type C4-dicarboxylate transport system substrate-binding protein